MPKKLAKENKMKSLKNNMFMLSLIWDACPVRVIINIAMQILGKITQLIYSIFLLREIMLAIESGNFIRVVIFILALVIFSLIMLPLTSWYDCKYRNETNVVIQKKIIEKIYAQAVRCDLECYEDPEFYDKYTRANDEILERGINILDNISNLFSMFFQMCVCIVIIIRSEPIILPIILVCAVASMFIDTKRSKLSYEGYKKSTPYIRRMDYVKRTVFLQDYAKELRMGNIFAPLLSVFDESLKSAIKVSRKYYGKASLLRVVRELFMSIGFHLAVQGVIIYQFIVKNAYPLSGVVTIINAAQQLQHRVYNFGNHVGEFIDNGLYANNIREFLQYEPKITIDKNSLSPDINNAHITLKNVSYKYNNASEYTLKNISIDIPNGAKIALVGHNGAGKSTLIKLILRLYDVSEGEILFNGINIKKLRLDEYRKCFTTVFQDFKIYAASLGENILLHPIESTDDKIKVYSAVKSSGLSEKVESLENGIDSQLTKEFDDAGIFMSGGEFQKTAVARVFADDAPVAILDEPSSALDPISEYEMFENMNVACGDKTVIFISHRLSSAVMADKIYMLENGKIVEEGTHRELMDMNGKYAEMFRIQAEKYREADE